MSTHLTTLGDEPDASGTGFCFHDELVALLPRLRVQALSLTRNRTEADDLVQSAVANALAAQASFTRARISAPGCTASCATASFPTAAACATRSRWTTRRPTPLPGPATRRTTSPWAN